MKTKTDQLRYIMENREEMERLANEAHKEMRFLWDNAWSLALVIFSFGFITGLML